MFKHGVFIDILQMFSYNPVMDILESKIASPRRHHILHRKRLDPLFDAIEQKKLTTVIAGAGFGKTTLVNDALAHLGANIAWYRLDEQDVDFSVFMAYLYALIQKKMPAGKRGLKNHTQALLEWLVFAEKKIKKQTLFVLDDFHLVQDSSQINLAIEFILNRLPEKLGLIIIGRKNLNIGLSTLRARQQLIEISEKDLVFTLDEIQHFFTNTDNLTRADFNRIQSVTGGWAASLVLLRYSYLKTPEKGMARYLEKVKHEPEYVFSYLKENFFDSQSEQIRLLMMKTSLLEEIDTLRFEKILGVENAGQILNQMVAEHLMIFPVDDTGTRFYLHHLFRDFLLAQLKRTTPQPDIETLHCKIAKQSEPHDVFMALDHYLKGHAFDDVIRLIEANEVRFQMEGKIHFLDQCLQRIPKAIIEKNPQLLLAQASLSSHYGQPRQATRYLTQAHQMFKKQKSNENMVRCLVSLGTQYYFSGYLNEAKLLMEQVIDEVQRPSPTYVMAMTFLTFLPSVVGEFKTADRYYKEVWDVIEEMPEFERKVSSAMIQTSCSHTLYFKGDFDQSQRVSKKLLKSVLEINVDQCVPLAYYQLSANCFFLQSFEDGCEYGKKGIQSCEEISILDTRKAWIYVAWAQNCLGLGKLDQATDLIESAIELFEAPGNRWGLASAWELLHQIYLAQGKNVKAKKILDQAVDLIEGYGLSITEGLLGNSYARFLMNENRTIEALESLEQARGKIGEAAFYLFDNYLLTARLYSGAEQAQKAGKYLSEALILSEKYSYEKFIQKEKWILQYLKEANSSRLFLENQAILYLQTIFKDELSGAPLTLKINFLGPFELILGDKPIPLSQWKSSKALMILKFLAANRSKGFVPREVLIEMLWPDEDIQKTGSRFNMAMSALRKTLEPDLKPKSSSAYISRNKDMYRLSLDPEIIVDVDQFSKAFESMQNQKDDVSKRLETCLFAQSLYRGSFLEEDRYEQWCFQKREQFDTQYLTVLRTIVDIYNEQDDFKQAVFYTRKIVEAEPFDEDAFKMLIEFYARSGDLPMVQKTYFRCKEMAQQMDCPVSPEIETVYRRNFKTPRSI